MNVINIPVRPVIGATEAMATFGSLPEVVQAWLMARGGKYGIPPHELLQKLPIELLDNPLEIFKFIDSKHISHLVATSKGGDPSSFGNWIFEDGAENMSRQADPMQLEEYLRAQIDSNLDASVIEFGTPDPLTPGYSAAYAEAFGVSNTVEPVQFDEVGDAIDQITGSHWDPIDRTFASSGVLEALENSFLVELGIPSAYVTFKGIGGVFPFLKSINWKEFKASPGYRNKQLARALRVFREHGWKELTKAVVIGFMIAAFPPLAYFMAAVGLTGVSALGSRWLANRFNLLPGPLASALNRISQVLMAAHAFLKRVLDALEKVVDVVIEVATQTVKKVVQVGTQFVKSVSTVAMSVAKDVINIGKTKASGAKQLIEKGCRAIFSWVIGWFGTPAPA